MSNINAYLQTLEEQTMVKGSRKPGDLDGAKNATIKPLSVKDVASADDLEEPEHLQGVKKTKTTNEERVKYNTMNNNNVFESLYKKAIQEDFDETTDGGFGDEGSADMGMGEDEGEDFGGEGEENYDEEGHVGKVQEVVQLLQQALDILTQFEGEEEEEYEEYEDEDGEDEFGGDDLGAEDEEEPVSEEEVQFGQAKTIGHALVNREKFTKGQDKKGNMVVKGHASHVAKKKASGEYGKGINGKPSNFSDAGGKKMQSKGNMKVPGRASNTGKFAFED